MSDSRLEKFIYAICSMDVTDLPVPLSRIETLWNCLITGETPDFEPLSRNEKYLMAMLDRYDISNLPAPMSRGEKLLYKIAVGETDLSDVPGYLSRYEELLKYLIENGEISEDDFEYVLYTLNQSPYTLYTTAEKPVKSAILKGLTLVNLSENLNTITKSVKGWYSGEKLMDNIEKLKRNTYYTVLYRLENLSGNHERYNGIEIGIGITAFDKALPALNTQTKLDKNGGWCKIKFQLTDDFIKQNPSYKQLHIRPVRRLIAPVEGESIDYTIKGFTILEGDYITNHIPFNEVFEGMQSVKMPVLTTTGKNLFDKSKFIRNAGMWIDENGNEMQEPALGYSKNLYYVGTGTFKISGTIGYNIRLFFYDKHGVFKGRSPLFTNTLTFSCDEETYVRIGYRIESFNVDNIQIEEGSTATSYEPYQSNILTVNEEVELRGIGDVKDTLDCLTGEVVERIGEVVLDGSQPIFKTEFGQDNTANCCVARIKLDGVTVGSEKGVYTNICCDKYKVVDTIEEERNTEGIKLYKQLNYTEIRISILKTKLSSCDQSGINAYLSSNPITVQYQLKTESVKTVDLTIVNQDGNETELRTFDDTTHVLLQSEAGPNPTAELTVKTKIPSASSTSLLMNDISTEQQQLEATVDEQSNNVDATMIATTEIFEETL